MDRRSVSEDVHFDRKHLFGHDAPGSWWLPPKSWSHFPIHTGDNGAGNGGNGYFAGSLIERSYAAFEPLNVAQAGSHATANAYQTNIVYVDQSATQTSGIGGDGGNWNAASGGMVGAFGSVVPGVIGTGDNSAGNGGDGHFSGSMVHAPVVVYSPINIAVAGSHSTADAQQTNIAYFDQSATQIAGVGGNGGNGNAASGGNVGAFGSGASGAISSGENSAGNGGDGYAYGGIIHATFAFYYPINIAVAGYNSTAHAEQTNDVVFDQSAVQMAGVGGDGGNGNAAVGGTADIFSSIFDLIGSDVIATGHNSGGNGGNGHFSGSLVDINVAIYAPINIAVAGYNSTAEAYQSNDVVFDQSTIQMAGIGGDGGHGNAALGGDLAMHLLADLHLLDHLA
ncbi:hypothetical protein [Bradyrhizobium valentinum]|uniref:PE-PGRS family protein n=1 Tax=Bradyrhizobium valentinum TaxID=1518501 RepID=A0A0R3K821_9BRAD|nr:hypothetical protein [Bradyrhizobium valentinum]KRQ91715.1 hypothetical protein CQ10_37130 [Bradyrhizobium valentinum]KRQ93161.1 hypothetical protein CP49_13525 [Bradyrhizobium valentinum]